MSTSQQTTKQAVELLRTAAENAKIGAFEQARTELIALLEIEPCNEIANGMLAAMYAKPKDPDHAVEYFERTLVIDPTNPLARVQLGLIQLELQQPQAALATFAYGLARVAYGHNEFLVRYYSGVALLQLKRNVDAQVALQQAQQFMPVDHVVYSQLLSLLIKLDSQIT